MKKITYGFCAMIALALAACAHYPESDVSDDGGSCGACPDGQTCVDGTCTAPPDGGGNPDGGVCTGSNCPTDGGNGGNDGGTGGGSDGGTGGGSDGGTGGGSDGGTGGGSDGGGGGGSDGGTCGTCPDGQTCVDGTCVCDGDGDDGSDGACGAGKTLLCHYPPGHPSNRHSICVGNPAVPAHQAHGDTLGACP